MMYRRRLEYISLVDLLEYDSFHIAKDTIYPIRDADNPDYSKQIRKVISWSSLTSLILETNYDWLRRTFSEGAD